MTLLLCVLLAFPVLMLTGCDGGLDHTERCRETGRIRVLMGLWPTASEPELVEIFEERRERFERENTDYMIVPSSFNFNPGTFGTLAHAGNVPTIFQAYFTEPRRLADAGWIRPITEQFNAMGWTNYMNPYMQEILTHNGQLFGVPRDGYGLGLLLNTSILSDPDVNLLRRDASGNAIMYRADGTPYYPTTFDELKEWSLAVNNTWHGRHGLTILTDGTGAGWHLSNIAWNFGADRLQNPPATAGGNWTANLNDSYVVDALEWIQLMRASGGAVPEMRNDGQWPADILNARSAMAIVGSDAIDNPIRIAPPNATLTMDHLALVPMPSVSGVEASALFGGVGFMFSNRASDAQVRGALKFLEFMGRAPIDSEHSRSALIEGFEYADNRGFAVTPTIRPWTNPAFNSMMDYIEREREFTNRQGVTRQGAINVNMYYFDSFFNRLLGQEGHEPMIRAEEPMIAQDMYRHMGIAVRAVFQNHNRNRDNLQGLLNTANLNFQRDLDRHVN